MSVTGWMLYTLTVSLLAAAAARSFEEGLTRVRVPSRWIWAVALIASVALPVAALFPRDPEPPATVLLPDAGVRPSGVSSSEPAGPVTAIGRSLLAWPAAVRGVVVEGLDRGLERVAAVLPSGPGATRWTLALWGWWSAALAGALAISTLLLTRRRRTWPRSLVRGRRVRIAPDVGPAVVGVTRPEIVLPGWLLGLGGGDLEMVLSHEEEHLRARDPLLLGASLVPLVAFPWNPVIWWQIRKLREAVEVDCDRRVLKGGASAGAYGGLLVRIGSRKAGSLLPRPALASSHPLLLRRLQAMRRPARGRRVVATLAGLVSLGFFGLALEARTPTVPPPAPEESPTGTTAARLSPPAPEEDGSAVAQAPALEPAPAPENRLAFAPGSTSPETTASAPRPVGQRSSAPFRRGRAQRLAAPATEVEPREWVLEASPSGPAGPAEESTRIAARMELPTTRPRANPRPVVPVAAPVAREIPVPALPETPPQLRDVDGIERALSREYPSTLRNAGIGGTVQIALLVTDGGLVSQALLTASSGHPSLDAAALRVAQTVQFTPASNGGRSVAIWTHLPITFQPASE